MHKESLIPIFYYYIKQKCCVSIHTFHKIKEYFFIINNMSPFDFRSITEVGAGQRVEDVTPYGGIR